MKSLLKLTRPHHWVKNLFVFMPIFFGGALGDLNIDALTLLAFFAFSFAASSIYCYNDIIDVEDDRRHTVKRHRPIASGAISIGAGYAIMVLLVVLSCLMVALSAFGTGAAGAGGSWQRLALVIAIYYVMELAYCRILKRYAIVDVCLLAFGFVLRILAGSAATGIIASHWLVLMTFLLTLLLSLAKRRDDVCIMERTGEAPRHNTERYNITFINQAITVTASVTLVCYIMYTISPDVTQRTNFRYVYLTAVLVILGLLRYMQLTLVDEKSGDPTKLLYSDRFLQTVLAVWTAVYFLMIYVL